jgi:hypothetical protein
MNIRLAALLILPVVFLCGGCWRSGTQPETNGAVPTPVPTVPDFRGQRDAALQAEADRIAPLLGRMPRVGVFVVDEPIEKKGGETERGVAYTTCTPDKRPTVFLKKAFREKANDKQLVNILKHEMTHAWFCSQGVQTGHDARFRAKFREIGGFGN